MNQRREALIVGAGPAGLACAVTLARAGFKTTILEKSDRVGAVWHRHYDRLHLHTDRNHSALPEMRMPRAYPSYPSRGQVVDYLDGYAAHFDLGPVFGCTVAKVARDGANWRAETSQGSFAAPVAVVATGWADFPYRPDWPGRDDYRGELIHSSEYRSPAPYRGKKVLVVGFGNSGGEIALDLAEANVDVTLAVRGPVSILPRDLLGLPILTWAIAQRYLPAAVADFIDAPLVRWAVGNTEKLGLKRPAKGPRRLIEEDGRIPLLDVGTVARIRDGAIRIKGGIASFTRGGVVFADSSAADFDAIILATGFRPDLRALLPDAAAALDGNGRPRVSGRTTAAPGLYFCGLIAVPTGQFREIAIEAKRIARLATEYVASHSSVQRTTL